MLNLRVAAVFLILLCFPVWCRTAKVRPRVLRMQATAFVENSKPTAAGTVAHGGIVASDPAVLPLGSRIRITAAGAYNGIYTVTDTGRAIKGRHIDLCVPSTREARQFGKKIVFVRILQIGAGKQDARDKDIPAATAK